jgi:hypothetical protein
MPSSVKQHIQISMQIPPTDPKHVVTLEYLDAKLSAKVKNPVRGILLSNLVGTYNSGDKTLTSTAQILLTADDIGWSPADRILVAAQSNATQNGIYVVTAVGAAGSAQIILTRASDFDESEKITTGVRIPVSEGLNYHDSVWVLDTEGTILLDTTELEFVQDIVTVPAPSSKGYQTKITGNNILTQWDIQHDLDTNALLHSIVNVLTGEEEIFGFSIIDSNNVRINTTVPIPNSKEYDVTIVAL